MVPEGVLEGPFIADIHVPRLNDEEDTGASGEVAFRRAVGFMGCDKARDEGCDGLIARKFWTRAHGNFAWATFMWKTSRTDRVQMPVVASVGDSILWRRDDGPVHTSSTVGMCPARNRIGVELNLL